MCFHVTCEAFGLLFCHSVPPLSSLCSFLSPLSVECSAWKKQRGARRQRQQICFNNYVHVWLCVCSETERETQREREIKGCWPLAERGEKDLANLSGAFMSHFCPKDPTFIYFVWKITWKELNGVKLHSIKTVGATSLPLFLRQKKRRTECKNDWIF